MQYEQDISAVCTPPKVCYCKGWPKIDESKAIVIGGESYGRIGGLKGWYQDAFIHNIFGKRTKRAKELNEMKNKCVLHLQDKIKYTVSKKGGMDKTLMLELVDTVWKP